MPSQETEIQTADGRCTAFAAWPEGPGAHPAVLLMMDGVGYREALWDKARRLAAEGFYALAPNLFYRLPGEPVPAGAALLQAENRPKLLALVHSLTPPLVLKDAEAFLDHLAAQPEVAPSHAVGVVGYCMGGSMALRIAAHFPDRVGAAASIHGGRLVTDAPDSPHRLLPGIRAALYFAHADRDSSMTAAQIETLESALPSAGVVYRSELYAGALHGFSMPDLPVYDASACERHWQRILPLFGALQ